MVVAGSLEPYFDLVEIEQPDLNIKRDKDGVVWVAGIGLTGSTDSGGLSTGCCARKKL